MASRQNRVESGAQAACSSGVPWNGLNVLVGGSVLAASAAPQQIWVRTSAAQIFVCIVLSLKLVHGLTNNRDGVSTFHEGAGDVQREIVGATR